MRNKYFKAALTFLGGQSKIKLNYIILLTCVGFLGNAASANSDLTANQIERIRVNIGAQLLRSPDDRRLRFKYAQASHQAGNHDIAKYHLRYLMRGSENSEELLALKKSYATVLEKSPFKWGINFLVLPSTNINKTASEEIFETPLGDFVIVGGGVEESGVGLRFGGRLSYEVPLSTGASLTYGLELNRNQYPADRLNHIDSTVSFAWGNQSLSGFTQITPYLKRYIYDNTEDGASNSTRYGIRSRYEHYLTSDSSITGAFTLERRDYDTSPSLDGNLFKISALYQDKISPLYHLRLQAGLSANVPELDHLRYVSADVSGELTRSIRNWGSLGFNIGLGLRDYKGDFPALGEPREDYSASIGMSFRSQHIKIIGSSPKLSCKFNQNRSNVALYEYQSTDCALIFERSF